MANPAELISVDEDPTELETYYIDTSVILNLRPGFGNSIDERAAKEFMRTVEQGQIHGMISPWVLLEIINVIRVRLIRNGMTQYRAIEDEVDRFIRAVFRIPNLRFISGNPVEMSQIDLDSPELWKVLEDSQNEIKSSKYTVIDDYTQGGKTLNGIGSNDALHLGIAVSFGCDFLATCDAGFWADSHSITIYDVRNRTKR